MKKWIALFLLMAVVCGVLAGCKGNVNDKEALQIALEDLAVTEDQTESAHVHTATYDNKPCFNIYITVNGVTWNYVISKTGDIIHKGIGEHAH